MCADEVESSRTKYPGIKGSMQATPTMGSITFAIECSLLLPPLQYGESHSRRGQGLLGGAGNLDHVHASIAMMKMLDTRGTTGADWSRRKSTKPFLKAFSRAFCRKLQWIQAGEALSSLELRQQTPKVSI